VFLRCYERECVTLEGGDRALFIQFHKQLEWGPAPEAPRPLPKPAKEIASERTATKFSGVH
jgi:hypothetical protein